MTSAIGLNDRDDAVHPLSAPDYYEWWYLDAIFPGGWMVTVTLFLRSSSLPGHIPLLIFDMYSPDEQRHRGADTFDLAACKASTEKCDVTLGGNRLRQEGDRWVLSVRAEKLGADLTWTRTVPGWKSSANGLIVDDATGKQGWCNAIPRGDVEGTLYIDGRSVPVRGGLGYHDHNWGDVAMERSVSGWGWGRAHTDQYTFVYGWLVPPGDEAVIRPQLFVAKGARRIFDSDDLPCKLSGYHKHTESGIEIPSVIEFGGKSPEGVQVDAKLILTSIMDFMRADNPSGIPTMYYRRLSRFDARIVDRGTPDSESGQAIDEYVVMPRT